MSSASFPRSSPLGSASNPSGSPSNAPPRASEPFDSDSLIRWLRGVADDTTNHPAGQPLIDQDTDLLLDRFLDLMRRSLVGKTRDYASKFNRETWFPDMVDKHCRLLSNSGADPSLIEILALLPSLRDRLLQNPSEEARALVERFEELYAGDKIGRAHV